MSPSNIKIKIDSSSLPSLKKGALKVLDNIRPNWTNINFKVYTDGITNSLIGAWNEEDKDDQILIRVYGENTELFIDRRSETENMITLHKMNMGPELYATFENGIAYGFVQGTPLTIKNLSEEKIWKNTAEEMAKFHKIKVKSYEACLFAKIYEFYNLLPPNFSPEQNIRLKEAGLSKEILWNEIQFLEKQLDTSSCTVVFSHNDMSPVNIIWNEARGEIKFIDNEYGAPNYQPFDVANYFSEFVGLEPIDYSLYPSEEFQMKWIRHYLKHYSDCLHIEEEEVANFFQLVDQFSMASHLLWGPWALLQACISSIDFDYMGYGISRLREYLRRKPLMFGA